MLVLSLIILCASALAIVPHSKKPFYKPEDAEKYFEEFIANYDKKYIDGEEKNKRLEIFKQNLRKINQKNSDPAETAVFGINQFTDLTTEEFLKRHTGYKPDSTVRATVNESVPITIKVPDSFDWRDKNAVTSVKKQLGCGSCWAFSATGAVEGAYAIKHGHLQDMSVQQLVDCATEHGCSGWDERLAIEYLAKVGGQESEDDYPYIHDEQKCQFDKAKIKAVVTKMLPYNLKNEEITKNYLVQNGPISVSIDATDLIGYTGGILVNCSYTEHNHGVLLVGYGLENGEKFWSLKNSWSELWAEGGYFRLTRAPNTNPCGLMSDRAAGAEIA